MAKMEPYCVISLSLSHKTIVHSAHKVKLLRIILELSLPFAPLHPKSACGRLPILSIKYVFILPTACHVHCQYWRATSHLPPLCYGHSLLTRCSAYILSSRLLNHPHSRHRNVLQLCPGLAFLCSFWGLPLH